MDKLIALQNFQFFAEKIDVVEGKEILIGDVEKTIVTEDGTIITNEKRAADVEAATYKEKPLVERIKTESTSEVETEPTSEVETEPTSEVETEPTSEVETEPSSEMVTESEKENKDKKKSKKSTDK